MAYLDVTPMIAAFTTSPDDFEINQDWLRHKPSHHRFQFMADGEIRFDADCDCSRLAIDPSQRVPLSTAFDQWLRSYWRPIEINREFASHFAEPTGWRWAALGISKWLERLAHSPRKHESSTVATLAAAE